jgi:nicotinamidase-related amidase
MINRLRKENVALLMIDIQEKLLPVIYGKDEIVKNTVRLLKAVEVFEIPMIYTEQYPKGIGNTVPSLLEALPASATRYEKNTFSCCDEDGFSERLKGLGRSLIVVFGIESHICVLSTVMDLLQHGIKVVVAADACGSRNPCNHNLALDEARACGASILPTESIVYQIIGRSGTQEFKTMLPFFK